MNDYDILENIIDSLTQDIFVRNRDKHIEWAKRDLIRLGVNVDELWNEELNTLLHESPKNFIKTEVFKKIVNEVYKNSNEKSSFFRFTISSRKESMESIIFNTIDDIEGKKEYIRGHNPRFWIDIFEGEEIKKFAFVELIKGSIYDVEEVERESGYNNLELDLPEFSEIYESIMEKLINQKSFGIDDSTIEAIEKIYNCISAKTKKAFLLLNISKIYFGEDYNKDRSVRIQISSIYNSLTEEEQEEVLANLQDNFSKAKLFYGAQKIENRKFLDVVFNFLADWESGNVDIETFKIKLALHNIDFDSIADSNFFDRVKSKTDFLNSQEFSDLINKYYETLSDDKKREFYSKLAYSAKDDRHLETCATEDFDIIQEIFDVNFVILSKIQDDNKFDHMSNSFKYGLLASGIIEDPKEQFEIIIGILEESINFNGERVIGAMKKLNSSKMLSKIEIEPEEVFEVFYRLYNKNNARSNDKILGAILTNLVSPESMMKYLETKPSDVFNIIDWYNANFFEILDVDESYKAKLLLSSKASFSDMDEFFWKLDDEYLRTQISLSKHSNGIKSIEEAESSIERYEKIKEEFLGFSSNEEKANYLLNLHNTQTTEELIESYKDFNDIKKSLLKYIDNHEARMKVIKSMKRYVEPKMRKYSDLAESMVREFFDENGGLTEEMEERMEIVFNRIDIFFAPHYESSTITGQARHLHGDISIIEHRINKPEKLLLDLVHEMAHTFSLSNFKSDMVHMGDKSEEGMADVFAETVLNYYFQKHKSLEIDGIEIEPQFPLKSTSVYHKENAYVRTMLYPLAQKSKDIEALKEFTLGDKSRFVELTLGEEFLSNCNKNSVGMPKNISINYSDVYLAHSESFKIMDTSSLYARKNYLLPALYMQSIMDERRNYRRIYR